MMQESNKLLFIRDNCLNLIRLLAAFQVMCGHALTHFEIRVPDALSKVLGIFSGVPIFFTLSGFLIWFSIARSENLKTYIQKRFWRIFPELWLGVAVEAVVLLILYCVTDIVEFLLFTFGQATILQFWTPQSLRGYGCGTPNGSLWTICVLIQFYVGVWWLYKILHGKSLARWIVIWCSSIVASNFVSMFLNRFAPTIVGKLYEQTILRYLWLFVIGCFVAEYYESVLPCLKKYWVFFIAVATLIYFTSFDINAKYHVFHSLFLFMGILGFAYRFPKLEIKKDISYGIYIYHMTVVNAMLSFGLKGEIIYLVIAFGITILLAYLSTNIMKVVLKNKMLIRTRQNTG